MARGAAINDRKYTVNTLFYDETSSILPPRSKRPVPGTEDYPDALQYVARNPEYVLLSDIDLVRGYRLDPDAPRGQSMAKELLRRHRDMLRKICWAYVKQYPSHRFEDFMQHAYVGAVIAYWRFKIDEGTRVSTHVHTTVWNHLLSSLDSDAFIHVPCQARAMRSYLSGKYDSDPEKKAAFERRKNLTTEAARQQAREKNLLLKPVFASLHDQISADADGTYYDYLADQTGGESEDDMLLRLDVERAISLLTPRQRLVLRINRLERFTEKETVDMVSALLGEDVTIGMVRSDLRAIRAAFEEAGLGG